MSFSLANILHLIDNFNNLFLIVGTLVGFVCVILLVVAALQATIKGFKR